MSELKKIKTSDREDYIKSLISAITEGTDTDSEFLCPTCRGTGLVLSRGIDNTSVLHTCVNCSSGVIKRCEFCGKVLNHYESCACVKAVYSRLLNGSMNAEEYSFEDAKKLSLMFYFPFFPSDLDKFNYFETWHDFFGLYNATGWSSSDIDRPEFIYSTFKDEFELEAMSILSGELEFRGMDVEKTIDVRDIKRLQDMLSEWSAQVKVPPCYSPNLSVKVRIPWENSR